MMINTKYLAGPIFNTSTPYPRCLLYGIALLALAHCRQPSTLFNKVSSSHSGIDFNNNITENDSINPLDLEFLYNGGGVAAGDFNADGLTDLYFTASQSSNKLYLNKGNLEFDDITSQAKVSGEGRWANGAAVVDINSDGLDDIYVCNTIYKDANRRKNLLYINQGVNKEGVPFFKEMAGEYRLDHSGYSVQTAFFDFDNDGDLDMYLLTTKLAKREAASFSNKNFGDTSKLDIDRLFRNDWNETLHHPVFTDISADAGIVHHGFGLGVAVADINDDGWKDIYVCNDFFGNDQLYINNKNGTFTNRLSEYFKHSSRNAMGSDVGDLNNDGLADVLSVDMNPEDNYRKKKNLSGNNYFIYQQMMGSGQTLQYVRNTLQINQGPVRISQDSVLHNVFSEAAFMAGVAETDWSWNPSIADFNNDGNKDIIITNGYPRDVTDHDFAAFLTRSKGKTSKQKIIDQIPQIKISNYAFVNEGNLKFRNTTREWGFDELSFSNGAIYADLDNDGDLDYVINNINQKASLFENKTNDGKKITKNFLTLNFTTNGHNKKGIGAIAEIYYGGKLQVYENSPNRGYLSTVENKAFFGLDSVSVVDSIVIRFAGKYRKVIRNSSVNKTLTIKIDESDTTAASIQKKFPAPLFAEVTDALNIQYLHQELDVIDFNEQRLLPHKLSEYGPGLAAGDVDGNGMDDLVIGGNASFEPTILLQQRDGTFKIKKLFFEGGRGVRRHENLGILLFDADNDTDLDLYFANGSNEFVANTKSYDDQLYINDGAGNFAIDSMALPSNTTSKGCIKAADFDNDGDLDLFIGGRVLPDNYPKPVSSFIFRNDSRKGASKFVDVTSQVAPALQNIGMVCDGIWTDFDNDGWTDLIAAGEWMTVTVLKNQNGELKNVTEASGLNNNKGWWNSISAGDLDNDGDVDYVVGNLGLNSFYRASTEQPMKLYASDFDGNGSLDLITTLYLPDEKNERREFPALTRDDHVDQLPQLKRRFLSYKEFAKVSINEMFTKEELKKAMVLTANEMRSGVLRNDGGGKFTFMPLPWQAQLAPVYGMVIEDFDGDGNLDIAINGNDYGTEVGTGRYDALNGLVLAGTGNCQFAAVPLITSGLYIPGNGKALVGFLGKNDGYLLAASQNRGPLKVFQNTTPNTVMRLLSDDKSIEYTLTSGKIRRQEVYYGNSFLSQSSHIILANDSFTTIRITNKDGKSRVAFEPTR